MVRIEEIPSDEEQEAVPFRRRKPVARPVFTPSPPPPSASGPAADLSSEKPSCSACPTAASAPTHARFTALYDTLGASSTDSLARIDEHYRECLTSYSSDEIIAVVRDPAAPSEPERTAKLRGIIRAYRILSDAQLREKYDTTGSQVLPEEELPAEAVATEGSPSPQKPAPQPAPQPASTAQAVRPAVQRVEPPPEDDFFVPLSKPKPASNAGASSGRAAPTNLTEAQNRQQREELLRKEKEYLQARQRQRE
eukprot:RCo012170